MYKYYVSNENLLFPPNLGDFIPEDAPVRLISDVVDQLDLTEVHNSYSQTDEGQPPYHPVMLMKAVLYGYLNNTFSTRGLEDMMKRDAHLIWLSGYQFPDHSTISRFKSRCMPCIKKIFSGLVAVLVSRGEIELAQDLYIDGSTIRSRAARRKVKWRSSHERFSALADEQLQEAITDLLEQIENGDTGELDERSGHVQPYTTEEARRIADEIERRAEKDNLKGTRGKISTIKKACDRKDSHDDVVSQCGGRCGVAPTDPDSGIMHAKEDGYNGMATPNYNVQIATQNQYVTNYDAYDSADDKSIAMDFVNTCIEENGVKPRAVVEDAGYGCEEVYVGLEELNIEAVVKYPGYDKESRRRPVKAGEYDKYGFTPSADGKTLICPNGKLMRVTRVKKGHTRSGFPNDVTVMTCDYCDDCPFKQQCAVTKNNKREIQRRLGNMVQERKAKRRLDLPENRAKLQRRSLEPEPVFGQLKHNHGYTRFRHFGKPKVKMDLGFVFMALNILKLHQNIKKRSKKPA